MTEMTRQVRGWCDDWNGSPMADGEQPRIIPRVRELRAVADEIDRLRAVILNIQSLAEKGFVIDPTKLATRCRRALTAAQGREAGRG